MEYKIAWFTEGGWTGKVSRNHPNMRNDMAWMHVLNVDHYPIGNLHSVQVKYDLGIVTIPKTNVDKLSQYPLIDQMRRICKKVGTMQEGPHWYFQDYSMEEQIWFYNLLMEMDFILCHNKIDVNYYSGLVGKKCYLNPTLMIEDYIEESADKLESVIIGGNMVRWYGGFDSYVIAQEFDVPIYAPSMGRKIDREDEMDIIHLSYMSWVEWIKEISRYKYGVHLMPTWAAGTFTLNCAYWGIPCIGYMGLDTQEKLHPSLSVECGDLDGARMLAQRLRDDSDFYLRCSNECKTLYKNSVFTEKQYIYNIRNVIKEVI